MSELHGMNANFYWNRLRSRQLLLYRPDGIVNEVTMTKSKSVTRQNIMDAAQALAGETGAGNISLDAVAARAGVSKGGLLYHFASKSRLMEAMVEDFLSRTDAALREQEKAGKPDAVVRAYIDQFLIEEGRCLPPPSGLLAALSEDPGLLDPVRHHERDFLDRIRANASSPTLATVAFLVVHAIRNMRLLNVEVLTEAELHEVTACLRDQLGIK